MDEEAASRLAENVRRSTAAHEALRRRVDALAGKVREARGVIGALEARLADANAKWQDAESRARGYQQEAVDYLEKGAIVAIRCEEMKELAVNAINGSLRREKALKRERAALRLMEGVLHAKGNAKLAQAKGSERRVLLREKRRDIYAFGRSLGLTAAQARRPRTLRGAARMAV